MRRACSTGTILQVQPPPERLNLSRQSERPSPDCRPQRRQPDLQGRFEPQNIMDCVDVQHQYKHPPHHHYPHHHHVQQQPLQRHHCYQLPIAGVCSDSGRGLTTSDVNSASCDISFHTEKEKQGLSQNLYTDQCSAIGVQVSFKPCEDGYFTIKAHEEARFSPKACDDVHLQVGPGRHENLHFVTDARYSHCQIHKSASALVLVGPHIRLLCSIGGRIMGRPFDGKLRYCGGDTRLINMERGICFSDFMAKLSRTYGFGLILKYQLPGEDLDALVSVCSDEDLQNMLDEYDKLDASGKNSWFRLFLFRNQPDLDASSWFDFSHGRAECCSQIMQRYIDAINSIDERGTPEHSLDVIIDNGSNGCLSASRVSSDTHQATVLGPCLATKAFTLVSSVPPSTPSSPPGAPRQLHHKQCGVGDTFLPLSKQQQSSWLPMNGLDTSAHESQQECHLDALKWDHLQSQIPGACSRLQQEPSHRRCDSPRTKENGIHPIDDEDPGVHQHECHRGTGTGQVDTWHEKSCELVEPQCEAHCGYHLVAQPIVSVACHGGQGETNRSESAAHCFVEGHRQFLYPHHLHHTGPSLLQRETAGQAQKGPDVGPVCQITDNQGISHFVKEPMHIHVQNANVTSLRSLKTSNPSSPQDVSFGRCGCCHKHFQVDRGISVSLGEHSHRQNPTHSEGPMTRRHGAPLVSRFHDGLYFSSDSGVFECVPISDKSPELDDHEYDACSKKHTLSRNNTFCALSERSTKDIASIGVIEPMRCVKHGNAPHCQICCADFHHAKGQLDRSSVSSTLEGHVHMDQFDPHCGKQVESIKSGRSPHDTNLERASDKVISLSANNGQGMLSVQNGPVGSDYTHVHGSNCSPVVGIIQPRCMGNSESFSSTDAVAGSVSSFSLEHTGWVDSPPAAKHNHQSEDREAQEGTLPADLMTSPRHVADGTLIREAQDDGSRNPSFDCIDCSARVKSTNSSANAVNAMELRSEIIPVSSFIPLTEDKSSKVTEDKTSISFEHASQSNFDDFAPQTPSPSFPSRMVDSDASQKSVALPLPVYDQSPISSISTTPFLLVHGESKSASLKNEPKELCTDNSSALMTLSHQNHGQCQEMAKEDVDSALHKISGHEQKLESEEAQATIPPPSKQSSIDLGVHERASEAVSVAESEEINQNKQEVNASGSVSICPGEDEKEEMPATQAEAEAIARGLQIIKNDDLEDLKELGSGTYGTVFHGKWRGSDVAIKRIKPSCFTGSPSEQERLVSDFWREAGTLSQLHHPNIVAFYGVVPDGPEGALATVTEYMVNGSLKQVLMKKDRTIDRKKRLLIAMDAAFGMEYLHSKRIVHFDLKSENLLVNMRDAHRPICKVGDFGLSKVKHQTLVSGGVRGTLPWMAPELLNTKGLVTEKVDVYSFGIVMWELLTGEEPYANMHCGTIIGGIVHNNLRPVVPSWCDPSWRDLMERCWSGNPTDRPDFSMVARELRAIASSVNIK